jgi:hypothetical protein
LPLPAFNQQGDMPPAVHRATLEEVVTRFSTGTQQRETVTARLLRICDLVRATGKLQRLILFGSYVTAKPSPRDIDIVLVMQDTFRVENCVGDVAALFDHQEADRRFGASIFWTRPSLLILETLDEFVARWQLKRDQTRRGIVELIL